MREDATSVVSAAMLPSGPMQDTERNIEAVHERIRNAAISAGRDPASIELLAVSKTRSVSQLLEAINAGLGNLGESKVQEANDKIPQVKPSVRWHLIGKLQANKARLAASLFDVVHSIDRVALVDRLSTAVVSLERRIDVYVQVEFARTELSNQAIHEHTSELCHRVDTSPGLQLVGLMTLPPMGPTAESARPYFHRLSMLRDKIVADTGLQLVGLSMGMTNDFEVAIEEGATIVRVGTAIFGPRI